MKGVSFLMEIERKYLIRDLPAGYDRYPSHSIEQAYICTGPVIRIRRQDDSYILTCKGGGMMSREELNLPMSAEAFAKLLPKAEGNVIQKKRFVIPLQEACTLSVSKASGSESAQASEGSSSVRSSSEGSGMSGEAAAPGTLPSSFRDLYVELDVFSGMWEGLVFAEVEFPNEETARQFTPPDWFAGEVTFDGRFHNSYMSTCKDPGEVLAAFRKILKEK